MSAEIKGLVRGPSGEIVPATVTLKTIPDPMWGSEGSVVTGGVVAASVRGPISVLVDAGRYQVQVDTPSRTIANHPITLTDGQVVTLAEIVGLSPSVPPEPGSNSNTGAQVAPGGQGGASSLTKEQLAALGQAVTTATSKADSALAKAGEVEILARKNAEDIVAVRNDIPTSGSGAPGPKGDPGPQEQTIDISTTHTYTLAPAANVQTVILTKSKPGIVDLTHPANVTWVPAPPELTKQVGSVVYLVFIKTGSGYQGYSAGDLDDLSELLATLPPMKSVIPKLVDNGWSAEKSGYKLVVNNATGSSADGLTIKLTHNVQALLPDSKSNAGDWWAYTEEASETEKAKTKNGPLSQTGRTQFKLGAPLVVEAAITSESGQYVFGLFGSPYNGKLMSISVNPNMIYELSGNGVPVSITGIKATVGDFLRFKYDGTNCTYYLKQAGKDTWTMLGTLKPQPLGANEKALYSRIDSWANLNIKGWKATGEFA